MLSRVSKWMIYISSFEILYLLLLLKIFGFHANEKMSIWETWFTRFLENRCFVITLLALAAISTIWMKCLLRLKNNVLFKGRLNEIHSIEMAGFFVAYVVSMFSIDINEISIIVNVVVFTVLGIAFVHTGLIHASPAFLIRGYKLYRGDFGYLLAKQSLEVINLCIDEHLDGISVRELCRNTYIIL